MTRAAVPPPINGSGRTNRSTSKSLLNLMRDVAGRARHAASGLRRRERGSPDRGGCRRPGAPDRSNSATEALSRFLPDLSFNWVIRLSQPMRAVPLRIQASSAWAGTALWRNSDDFAGSIPLAISAAAISRTFERSSAGSMSMVSAWRSARKNRHSRLVLHPHPAAGSRPADCRGEDRRSAGFRKARASWNWSVIMPRLLRFMINLANRRRQKRRSRDRRCINRAAARQRAQESARAPDNRAGKIGRSPSAPTK